jgi:hypothetical protein
MLNRLRIKQGGVELISDGWWRRSQVKSAMMLFAGPIIPFYFVVSFLNQVGLPARRQ